MDLTIGLVGQWRAYVAAWQTYTPSERSVFASYAFWHSKRIEWPDLARLAVYWTSFPTSSIAAERTFAVLRHVQTSLRTGQLVSTVRREVMFRVNRCVSAKRDRDRDSVAVAPLTHHPPAAT